jgi:prolyl-tRNA synthetase
MAATGDGKPELVSTPGQAAIADVTKFFNIEPSSDIKCVAYMGQIKLSDGTIREKPIATFLRGDHQVNETKLAKVAYADTLRPMGPEELERYLHAPAGFLGPVGLTPLRPEVLLIQKGYYEHNNQLFTQAIEAYPTFRGNIDNPSALTVILDPGLENRQNLVCGANKLDYHYRNVVPGRDFQWTRIADIRNVLEGEGCPSCGQPLHVAKAVEVGHIFKLGNRYTDKMGVRVLDTNGKEVTPIMGCYGIGIERILTAAIEQGNDANGFWLPRSIAPFDVVVTITNVSDPTLNATGEKIAADLEAAGFDVLLDDRDERAGVKFKDADLIGVPYRITVGRKAAEGKVELVTRATASGRDVAIADVAQQLGSLAGN